jgi:hypothetical protein
MKVIFDKNLVQDDRYTFLELDTVMQPGLKEPVTLYAVVDELPLEEIVDLEALKVMHQTLIANYKTGKWDQIESNVEPLRGKFKGELDSFYQNIIDFAAESAKLNKQWDGVRHITSQE